jgi:hypothetical protein
MSLYKLLSLSTLMLFNTEAYSSRIEGVSGVAHGLYDDALFELSAANKSHIFGRNIENRCGPEFGSCPPGICCSPQVCADTRYLVVSLLICFRDGAVKAKTTVRDQIV